MDVFNNISSTKPCGFKILSHIVLNQADTRKCKNLASESQGDQLTANGADVLGISSCTTNGKETQLDHVDNITDRAPIKCDDEVLNTSDNEKTEDPKNQLNGINNVPMKSEKSGDPANGEANGNHSTAQDDILTISDCPDSEDETKTKQQPRQASRKRNNDHLAEDEEIVFNYMTGLYEKTKKAKISTDIEIFGEIKEEMSIVIEEETELKSVPETDVNAWFSATLDSKLRDSFITSKEQIVDTIDLTDDGDGALSDTCTDSKSNKHADISSKLVCETCSYKAASKQQLIFHLYNNHLKGEYSINFKCKLCAFKTTCEKSILSHENSHGNSVSGDISLSKNIAISIFKREADIEEVQTVVGNSHSDNTNLISYKCFDCYYTFKLKKDLKIHCRQHKASEFTCDKHFNPNQECLKCIYSNCLLDVEGEVRQCVIPNSKKTKKDHFDTRKIGFKHITSNDSTFINESLLAVNGTRLRCYHCFYVASSISSLKSHALVHSAGSFDCDFHSISDQICSKCVYSHVLEIVKRERQIKNNEIVFSVNNEAKVHVKIREFKCYLCTYVSRSRSLLKIHALNHYKEEFNCNLHSNKRVDICAKCVYHSILEELKREILLCQYCGFKTLRESTFSKHQSSKENCKKFADKPNIAPDVSEDSSSDFDIEDTVNNTIIEDSDDDQIPSPNFYCFDCNNFKTDKIEKLKEHSIAHYKTNFVCNEHVPPGMITACGKCLYSDLKLKATKNLFICQKCPYKTLRKDCFQKHVRWNCKNKGNNGNSVQQNDLKDSDEDNQFLPSEIKVAEKTKNDYTKYIQASKQQSFDYICYHCENKMFKDVVSFEKHIAIHRLKTFKCTLHDEFHVYCKKCVYQFALNGIDMSNFICKYCTYKNSHLEPVLIHMKGNCSYEEDVALVEITYHKCYDCGFEADSREVLWKHSFKHQSRYECLTHQLQKKKTCPRCFYASLVNRGFTCKKCDAFSNSEYDLRVHVECMHYKTIPFKCSLHMENTPNPSCRNCFHASVFEATSGPVNCPICRQPYPNLKNHYNDKHRNFNFNCPEHPIAKRPGRCNSCYAEKILEKIQGRQRPYVCLECNYECETFERFELHVNIYHTESVFHCTKHTWSDIDALCDMCVYEHVTLIGS